MAEFKLPEVGEGIESGVVVSILVSVGDTVEKDQPVIELETDKAVVEVPSDVSGTVESINVKENEEAEVGQVIMTLGEGDAGADSADDSAEDGAGTEEKADTAEADSAETEDTADAEKAEAKSSDTKDSETEDSDAEQRAGADEKSGTKAKADEDAEADGVDREEQYTPAPDAPDDAGDRKLIPAAPSVRRLAREMGINLQEVQGSGIMGRISAEDLRRYQEGDEAPAQKAPAAPPQEAPSLPDFSKWGETERVAMSGIRKATVRSMTQAWSSVPMVTQFDKADITEFEALRKRYQPKAEAVGAKLTPTAMLLKVVAGALRKFPDFNASIDTASNEVVYKKYVNLGVAVDTDKGLLVPVIKNADRKNMVELAQELGELAEKARDRKLSPEQMQGGNFNVSNLGGIGGTGFTPIVNPPDVAILGVSRGGMEPVWNKVTETFEATHDDAFVRHLRPPPHRRGAGGAVFALGLYCH